jgi:hypothetical protein
MIASTTSLLSAADHTHTFPAEQGLKTARGVFDLLYPMLDEHEQRTNEAQKAKDMVPFVKAFHVHDPLPNPIPPQTPQPLTRGLRHRFGFTRDYARITVWRWESGKRKPSAQTAALMKQLAACHRQSIKCV